eukprot:MONOS_5439.1-p1 / transcript=MONOS_5439.1 / gene=MONOS_5439 / organism=Monocercomonoides_exilis_PA203 / gene_product= Caffine, Calcium, Zinc sensitivity 1 (Ccz1) / transcript_product= Caffine, Calcium, Zinc sensitivity 1 (Ccz1) / location=Mono_scaffold00158:28734-31277(+) / protein_length=483 / sequence_SO=supercontig / SO=protein_coding / is_pseudo=false
MVMVVKNPSLIVPVKDEAIEMSFPNDLHDFILRGIVQQLYINFRLTNGSMNQFSRKELRDRCNTFFQFNVEHLDFTRMTFFDRLSGLDVALLSTPSALCAQTMVSEIESLFPFVTRVALFHEKSLLFSELNMDDTHALYVLLFGSMLLPAEQRRFGQLLSKEDGAAEAESKQSSAPSPLHPLLQSSTSAEAKQNSQNSMPPAYSSTSIAKSSRASTKSDGPAITANPYLLHPFLCSSAETLGFVPEPVKFKVKTESEIVDATPLSSFPLVYLDNGSEPHRLLIFKHSNISYLLFIPQPSSSSSPATSSTSQPSQPSPSPSSQLFFPSSVLSEMDRSLSALSKSSVPFFSSSAKRSPSSSDKHHSQKAEERRQKLVRHVFINHVDLLIRSNIADELSSSDEDSKIFLQRDILHLVCEIHKTLNVASPPARDVLLRTSSGHWITGRKLCEREVIGVFPPATVSGFIDANDKLTELFRALQRAYL